MSKMMSHSCKLRIFSSARSRVSCWILSLLALHIVVERFLVDALITPRTGGNFNFFRNVPGNIHGQRFFNSPKIGTRNIYHMNESNFQMKQKRIKSIGLLSKDKLLALRLMGVKDDAANLEMAGVENADSDNSPCADDETDHTSNTPTDAESADANETKVSYATTSSSDVDTEGKSRQVISTNTSNTTESPNSNETEKWEANNFERDYVLLKTAMAKQSSMSNLQQQQRKYTLDYGFARNRRPLIQDMARSVVGIGGWMVFLIGGGAGRDKISWINSRSWWRKIHFFATKSILTLTGLHHWVVGCALPLFLLAWAKSDNSGTSSTAEKVKRMDEQKAQMKKRYWRRWRIGNYGPSARALDEYSSGKGLTSSPVFSYTSELDLKKMNNKDTGDFVLCLLENWSSAVVVSFVLEVAFLLSSLVHRKLYALSPVSVIGNLNANPKILPTRVLIILPILSRLLTRLGGAAALHQYPSLLFELRRKDQPLPLCRPTMLLNSVVNMFLGFVALGVASDLALMFGDCNSPLPTPPIGNSMPVGIDSVGTRSILVFLLSVFGPIGHIIALLRIVSVSKCSALSLAESTSFSKASGGRHLKGNGNGDDEGSDLNIKNRNKCQWRYQLRWRTPQRILLTLRAWISYFFTGHDPLLMELDYWKQQPIRFDGFHTEGSQFRFGSGKDGEKISQIDGADNSEELIPRDDSIIESHVDAITESLTLIFRDRDAALRNATEAKFSKQQESYDTKTLDDVLGVAVQQTFGVGLSFDFDHFDSPAAGEVSIHQLRARMAKSAIRRKKELEASMKKELDLLHRLKDNISSNEKNMEAVSEIVVAEQEIRERCERKIDRMRNALLSMIPTNVAAPKGTERFENPIMVGEYVNLTAPVERKDLKATVGSAPDLDTIQEYVRRDFGEEAAEAFKQEDDVPRIRQS